jgi:hypothetical protein
MLNIFLGNLSAREQKSIVWSPTFKISVFGDHIFLEDIWLIA